MTAPSIADAREDATTGARPLLKIENLDIRFEGPAGIVQAVDDFSLSLTKGETLAIVGESGCGKSVTAMSILGLVASPGRIAGGTIGFRGLDLASASEREMKRIRGSQIGMIFQDPMTSLNPLMPVGRQIAETVRVHRGIGRKAASSLAVDMLRLSGIPDPSRRAAAFPHELSGGMRQRVMIAMAIACDPSILIADEPTTALDVTIQAQILEILRQLKERTGIAIILVTHDLGVVAEMADRVIVMYAGRKVEEGKLRDVLKRPRHPYTAGLIASVPRSGVAFGGVRSKLHEIPGTVPAMMGDFRGCVFAPRCSRVQPRCHCERPPLTVADGQLVACWYPLSAEAAL